MSKPKKKTVFTLSIMHSPKHIPMHFTLSLCVVHFPHEIYGAKLLARQRIGAHAAIPGADRLQQPYLVRQLHDEHHAPACRRHRDRQRGHLQPVHRRGHRECGERNEALDAAVDEHAQLRVAFDEQQRRIDAQPQGGQTVRPVAGDRLEDATVHNVLVDLRRVESRINNKSTHTNWLGNSMIRLRECDPRGL